ncbi:MAG: PUA domain-containing protein [Halobacteria archaeon]
MASDLYDLRTIADYQFGGGVGKLLFPEEVNFTYTKSDRIRQVTLGNRHVATLKTTGRFTLGVKGAELIRRETEPPEHRVVFGNESIPFLEDGRNGFAKFVRKTDPKLRSRDEVLITGPGDSLLGTGRTEMSSKEMLEFDRGVAVKQR